MRSRNSPSAVPRPPPSRRARCRGPTPRPRSAAPRSRRRRSAVPSRRPRAARSCRGRRSGPPRCRVRICRGSTRLARPCGRARFRGRTSPASSGRCRRSRGWRCRAPDIPRVEMSRPDIPRVERSMTNIPRVERSMTDIPRVELSMPAIPRVEMPRPDIPRVEMSRSDLPRVGGQPNGARPEPRKAPEPPRPAPPRPAPPVKPSRDVPVGPPAGDRPERGLPEPRRLRRAPAAEPAEAARAEGAADAEGRLGVAHATFRRSSRRRHRCRTTARRSGSRRARTCPRWCRRPRRFRPPTAAVRRGWSSSRGPTCHRSSTSRPPGTGARTARPPTPRRPTRRW